MNLIEEGVVFDRFQSNFSLGLEGGHTKNRIIHAGDYTGREIEKKLVSAIRKNRFRILPKCHLSALPINARSRSRPDKFWANNASVDVVMTSRFPRYSCFYQTALHYAL